METKATTMIPDKVIGIKSEKQEISLSEKDTILYSLGIGISTDPYKESDFEFTYEFGEKLKIFPTQFATLPLKDAVDLLISNNNIPEFNPMSLLHGEIYLTILKQADHNEKLNWQSTLIDYEDKGSGTVFMFQAEICSDKNEKLYIINSSVFVRDIKGHNYKSKGPLKGFNIPKSAPTTKPDFTTKYTTTKNQALLYRLGGLDPNPLHADINMAKMGGFDFPILHGMCFYGIACRGIYDLLCDREVENIVSFNSRFTSHVFPGETIELSIWKQKGDKFLISAATSERKKQVLLGEAQLRKAKF